ncbi:MAG: hypothetical protein IT287_00610 [Bdellovibrionaceae bacterium]|nr:hypothetical protein [Pseudobdellovibrionaceae bacterium]
MNRSLLTKPEDLICCIAKDQNIEIAVAHSSIAAQNSDYNNPRVLLISKDKKGNTTGILSINSGAPHLNQKDNVELMYNNATSGQVEMYDISFETSEPKMSGKNPESCMNCHGGNSDNTVGGPKTIFEAFPWPRFVDESRQLALDNQTCPNRAALNIEMQKKANTAVKTAPRYSCIKDKPRTDLQELDDQLLDWNERRIAKNLKNTSDYQKFKYAIIGSSICDFNITEWLPKEVLAKMTINTSIHKNIKNKTNPAELARHLNTELSQKSSTSMNRDKALVKSIPALPQGKSTPHSFDLNNGTCDTDIPSKSELSNLFANNPPLLNQYFTDSMIQGDESFGTYRFLLESRGIDISDWSTSAINGYDRAPKNLWVPLVLQEPKNSAIHKLLNTAAKYATSSIFITKTLQEADHPTETCNQLKKLSLKAFPTTEETEAPSPTPTILQ